MLKLLTPLTLRQGKHIVYASVYGKKAGFFFIAKWWDKQYIDQLAIYSDTEIKFEASTESKSKDVYSEINNQYKITISLPFLNHKFHLLEFVHHLQMNKFQFLHLFYPNQEF